MSATSVTVQKMMKNVQKINPLGAGNVQGNVRGTFGGVPGPPWGVIFKRKVGGSESSNVFFPDFAVLGDFFIIFCIYASIFDIFAYF